MRVSRKISQVRSSALPFDFFERLINRHGADGHGRVAENPFARGVDVLAGGEVHDGVRAPLGGPAHLLDFLLDARRDGAVADVGVDLHEEVAPDDHRLGFGVIDVARDDGAAGGDFAADELGRDLARGCAGGSGGRRTGEWIADCDCEICDGTGVLLVEVVADDVVRQIASAISRRLRMFSRMAMNSISGVMMPCRAYQSCVTGWPALARSGRRRWPFRPGNSTRRLRLRLAGEFGVFAGEVAVVLRLHFAAVVFLDVAALRIHSRRSAGRPCSDVPVNAGSPHGPEQS